MDNNLAYLGVAVSNPIQLVSGRAVLRRGLDVVQESIMDILSTPVGTRLFLPEYGSRMEELLFETNDQVLEGMARMFIVEAIERWEKRVRYVDSNFKFTDEAVYIEIVYRILPSNEIRSFVYPFYRELIY